MVDEREDVGETQQIGQQQDEEDEQDRADTSDGTSTGRQLVELAGDLLDLASEGAGTRAAASIGSTPRATICRRTSRAEKGASARALGRAARREQLLGRDQSR